MDYIGEVSLDGQLESLENCLPTEPLEEEVINKPNSSDDKKNRNHSGDIQADQNAPIIDIEEVSPGK
jgi:hypothetical protein